MRNQQGTMLTAERNQVLSELRLLIESLDRRVPHLDRLGEAQIIEDAAELRRKAVGLIAAMGDSESETS
jgi:hypothetical protein